MEFMASDDIIRSEEGDHDAFIHVASDENVNDSHEDDSSSPRYYYKSVQILFLGTGHYLWGVGGNGLFFIYFTTPPSMTPFFTKKILLTPLFFTHHHKYCNWTFYSNCSSSDDGRQGFNVRTEPKFIVFVKQLLLLFQVCSSCKVDGLLTKWKTIGTMVEITTLCANPTCKEKTKVWKSQPDFPETKIPAGNFLVSFAIVVSGACVTKISNVFRHMGLSCISLSTYYNHQKVRTIQ